MGHNQQLAQPALGFAGAAVTITLSLIICAAFEPSIFGTWVAFLTMCMVPTQIVVSSVWQNRYPTILIRLPQPLRGIAVLAIVAAAGCVVVAPVTYFTIGGGVSPPTPFLVMYIILTITVTLWAVVVFQCWPMIVFSTHPGLVGVGTLALSYAVAYALFRTGFNFSSMSGAPFYLATLDPLGVLPAWRILTFTATTVPIIMGLVILNFWPLSLLTERMPTLGKQPLFGLLVGAFVLGLTTILWMIGVNVLEMDVVDFLVRVTVSWLFGEFIVLILFQTPTLPGITRPIQRIGLVACSASLAFLTYGAYRFVARSLFGDLPNGAPTYTLDLWIATAMLSVTFPVIVAYVEGFGYWPFVRCNRTGLEN